MFCSIVVVLYFWIDLVTVFMGLFLGFIFCFSGFDGDWVWLLDLDLGFVRD